MDRQMIKMLLKILCICVALQFIEGASHCPQTNTNPKQHCTDGCTLSIGCRNSRKRCLCDGDCGYSCVYPNKRCSKPRTIRNGQVVYKQYRFNDTQRAVCKSGFKLAGSPVRTCRGIGYWDGKQARCKRPQNNCKDPGTDGLLLRTTPAKKSFKPGTKLNYYCPHKFTVKGTKLLICKKDGTWSAALPKCVVPKCRPAVLPPHTQVLRPRNWKSRRNYGVRLSLSCDYGYTSAQRGTFVCDPPGWKLEPSSFKCFPKSCPNPGRPRNGNIKGLFVFGKKVTYSCDKCYKLNGVSYRTCQADQKWTDTQPTCDPVTCSLLKNPTNGYLTSNSQQCDSIVQYHCDAGYNLIGSSKRRCQSDGTWSGTEPKCQRNSCVDPGAPVNGRRKGAYLVGQTVTFSCDPCYQLSGNKARTCQADLTWSGHQPTCRVIKCSYLRKPSNGQIVSRYLTDCGTQLHFVCNKGYTLKGSSKRSCQNTRRWSGMRTACVKTPARTTSKAKTQAATTTVPTVQSTDAPGSGMIPTTNPTTPQFIPTTIAINSPCGLPTLPYGATVRVAKKQILLIGCKQNFAAVGSGIMKCNTNTQNWQSIRNITCIARSCPTPVAPKHGYKHGISYFIGDNVTYSCDPCYRLVGVSQRTCLKNKTWSDKLPSCVVKTCKALSDTVEASVYSPLLECGSIATYTCKNKKLTILGSDERKCNTSGMWEGPEPKCMNPHVHVNIALNKPASMSSHWPKYGGPASVAVDGNRRGKRFHTKAELGAWWRVDLGQVEPVSTVVVVNRRGCCTKRINGFKVSVGSNPKRAESNALCGGRTKAKGGENIIHCTKTLRGRYVFVYLPKNKFENMSLHEVEVYRKKLSV